MRKVVRYSIVIIFLNAISISGHAQQEFFNNLKDLISVTEAFEKLVNFFNSAGDEINKQKVKDMTAELYLGIGELILAKDSLVLFLESSGDDENLDYAKYIDNFQFKLEDISRTLDKYKGLIAQAGINALELNQNLKEEFLKKATQLRLAKTLFNQSTSNAEVKSNLIIYMKSSISILKDAQSQLKRFEY